MLFSVIFITFSTLKPVSAATGINHQINFQGKLVNTDGTNVTDGTYSIIFSLYTVSSAGSNIWTETQSVTVSNGIFQVNLGSVTTLPGSVDFNTDNIYLGIKVGADAEMTPRVQFTSVPQAFNSEKLGGLDKTGFIQNQTATTQTADFKINGTGNIGTSLTTPLLQAAAATALTITGNAASTWSTSSGNITLQAGGGTVTLGTTGTLTSASALSILGGTTLSLDSTSTNALTIGNSANAKTITIGNVTGATQIVLNTGSGGILVNQTTGSALSVTTNAVVPTVDQVSIDNTGSTGVTTAGVSGLQVSYKGGAAAVESSAERIDLQPGGTTGGTWNAVHLVQNVTGPATGVTSNGVKLEGPATTGGAGTYNAINIANIGTVASGGTVRGINITGTNSNAAGTVRGIQLNNITGGAASEIGIDLGTGWDSLLTYNNGAKVIINATGFVQNAAGGTGIDTSSSTGVPSISTGTWSVAATLAATLGGTGTGTYAVGDLLTGDTGNTLAKITAVGSGSCLISQGLTTKPIWGACGSTGVTSLNTFTGALSILGTANQITVSNSSPNITLSLPTAITTGSATFNTTGANALAVTGAPTNSATSSLLQVGNAIASGNTTANGGTYIGLNAPAAGAGSAADFLNFQANGVTKLQVTSNGSLTIKNSSTTAFQVQNSTGAPIFLVDTATTSNLVTNPGFEVDTSTGWTYTSATGTQNLTKSNTYHGQASNSVNVTVANGSANVTSFTAAITPAQYTFSFYAMKGTNNGTLSVAITGGSAPACALIGYSTPVTTGFQRYYCTFTSTTTNVTAISIKSNNTGTFYLDAVELNTGALIVPYAAQGTIQLRGVINSPMVVQNTADSTSAFQIQNSAGTSNLFVADTLNSGVSIGGQLTVTGLNNTISGNLLINGAGSLSVANGGSATFANTGANAVAITGAPTNSATSSLLQVGNAIASGNTTANGGTYFGLNAPLSGAGSAADFLNFQLNSANKLLVTSAGALTTAGLATLNGGVTLGNNTSYSQPGNGTFSTGSGTISLNGATTVTGGNNFTVNTGTTTIGGATSLNGALTINNNTSITSGSTLTLTGTLGAISTTTGGNNLNFSRAGANYLTATDVAGDINLGVSANQTALTINSAGSSTFNGNLTTTGTIQGNSSLTLGTSSTTNGSLVLKNATNANTISLLGSGVTTSYTLTVAPTGATGSQCLQSTSGSTSTVTVLQWGACGSGSNLQGGYTASTGSTTPEILLDTTRNGLDIQDANTTIGATQALLAVRASATATTLGTGLFVVNASGKVGINTGSTSTTPTLSYDLSFGQGANRTIGVEAQATAATAGNNLTVQAGTGNTTGAGGLLTLQGGAAAATAASNGGGVTLQGANGSATGAGGNGGAVTINAGNGLGTGPTNGGSITLQAGSAVGTGTAGQVLVKNAANSTVAFQVQNTSAAALFTADTSNMRLGVKVTYAAMSVPGTFTTSTATTGGVLAQNSTYRYKVTAIDAAGGETTSTAEVSQLTGNTTATNTITLTAWTASSGAAGYRIYRTAANGLTNTETLYDIVSKPGYTDTGIGAFTAGSVPATSTAYVSTNVASPTTLSLAVGGLGSPAGQLYVSGTLPTAPIGKVNTATNPWGIYHSGNYLYSVNKGGTSLQIFDATNPASPSLLTNFAITGSCETNSVMVAGRYAYVADDCVSKFYIIDISNVKTPVLVNTVATVADNGQVLVQGRYAYTFGFNGAFTIGYMQIFDISNPTSVPAALSTTTPASTIAGMQAQVLGKYVYMLTSQSTGNNKLWIYDISNPASPALVNTGGTLLSSVETQGPIIVGHYAYILNTQTNPTFEAWDIKDPTAPFLANSVALDPAVGTPGTGSPQFFTIQGRYAYITNPQYDDVNVVDVSNPLAMKLVGAIGTNLKPIAITVNGRYMYVQSYVDSKIDIYDIGGTYTQSLESGSIVTGNIQSTGLASFDSDLSVFSSATIGQNLQVNEDLGVSGSATISGSILVGSATTDTTQKNLQTDSSSTYADSGTCNTTTNQGALYYNTASDSLRECEGGNGWTEVATIKGLGILAFGIMPDSGSNPGDMTSVTGAANGPCKVQWLSATSVSVAACTAYSGGRKVNVTATTINTVTGTTPNIYEHICLNGTNNQPAISAAGTETANLPTFSITAPILCLADIKVVSASATIDDLYDVRTYLNTQKEFVTEATSGNAPAPGMVSYFGGTTAGTDNITNQTSNMHGIVVATSGTTSNTVVNAIIAVSGPAWVKATAGSFSGLVINSATVGYAITGAASANAYGTLGVTPSVFSTTCTTTANCSGSLYTSLSIR